jgi:hypothetical protein
MLAKGFLFIVNHGKNQIFGLFVIAVPAEISVEKGTNTKKPAERFYGKLFSI